MSDTSRTDRVRDRAYNIWETEGRVDGHHERHWHQATHEIDDGETPELPHDAGEAPEVLGDAAAGLEAEDASDAAPPRSRVGRDTE